jgi:hypothetical protein
MPKLISKKLTTACADNFLLAKQKNQVLKAASNQSKAMGSSLIELLLATAFALFAAGTAARIMNNLYNSGLNRRAAATSAIEVAISNDLAWFRQYAVLWRLLKGPFPDLSTQVTHTTIPYEPIPNPNPSNLSNKYEPIRCNTNAMAIAFRDDAATSTTYVAPINSPPNPVPNNNSPTTIALPAVASGFTLVRRIEAGPTFGTLTIAYAVNSPAANIFERSSSIYLPAAGWCSP